MRGNRTQEYPVAVIALVLFTIAAAYLVAAIAKPEWFA